MIKGFLFLLVMLNHHGLWEGTNGDRNAGSPWCDNTHVAMEKKSSAISTRDMKSSTSIVEPARSAQRMVELKPK